MASMWDELKRRNVVRVAIAYAVVSWLILQLTDVMMPILNLPEWVDGFIFLVLAIGFILAILFSWIYELTPEGIKREKDVDRSASITRATGRKLDRLITGVLILAVAALLVDRFYSRSDPEAVPVSEADPVVVTEGRQSIAVLPFVNMSDDSDHFADGLTEELMNVLAKNQDLQVAGRTSSFAFKGETPNFGEVGDALGVEHVLEGSVRRSGERIRVTAQLIKVADGFHLWSETYDRDLTDIFEIQDDVAGAISEELNLRLMPTVERLTDNLDAYVLYLQAKAEISSNLFSDEQRIESIDRILALDPEFAEAAELKAIAYFFVAGVTMDTPSSRLPIHEAASAALQLNPDLVIARALFDMTLPDTVSWVPEFKAVERAIEASPNDYLLLGIYRYELLMAGYFKESVEVGRRMVAIEPLSESAHSLMGLSLMAAGQEDEAYGSFRRAAEIGGDVYLLSIAAGRIVAGDREGAVEPLERAWAAMGLDPADARPFIDAAADPVDGKAFLDEAVRRGIVEARDLSYVTHWQMWYLVFGYLEDYFDIIDRYYAESDSSWTNADQLEGAGHQYSRSGYMKHPAYLQHMQRVSFPEIWDERGPPDRCSKQNGEWVCE